MRGFTLVEVLVTMSIVVVAGLLLVGVIVNFTGLSLQQSSKVSQGVSVNDSFMKIREVIKSATAIVPSYPESGVPLYTTSATQLVLKVQSLDQSSNIIASNFDYFVFLLDGGKLKFKLYPDPVSSRKTQDQILSTAIDTLQFQYLNNTNPSLEVTPLSVASKIRITIALKQKNGLVYESTIATSEASLRND